MKKLNILFLSLIAVFLFSCDDFLETEMLTKKLDANYYTTPEEATEALVGCYDALQLIYSAGQSMTVVSDVMSDLCFGGTGAGDPNNYKMFDEYDVSVAPASNNDFEPAWLAYYKGINRVNTLLLKMEQIDWSSNPGAKSEIEGEALFLRAYFYFDLVRMFGRVPLLLEPSADVVPQSEPDEVFKAIAEDLLVAIENCSDKSYSQMADGSFGHATKWAAEGLLARVYLYYTGRYEKSDLLGLVSQSDALGYCEDIIANSGHGLVPSFYDLWPASAQYKAVKDGNNPYTESTYAGETNQEVVFSVKYTYTSDYDGNTDGNHWMVMNGIRLQSVTEYGYAYGWGACTVLPEFYASFDANDDRRDATIMGIVEEGIDYTKIKEVKEYTGYFTKKYTPVLFENEKHSTDSLGAANFMVGQYQDYFVLRYADILLMAAELGSANALDYVNEVHGRSCPDVLTAVDKNVIFDERRNEFAFEGIWYWDLLRYDSSLDYAANAVAFIGTVKTGNVDVDKVIDPANLKLTKGLFQIPNSQITLSNNVYQQNPGWE